MQHYGVGAASPEATRLADQMMQQTGVMEEILRETIPEGDGGEITESGRTMCGDEQIKGPLARFPTSVELAECPRGVQGGTWHTHVTKEQLRRPTNSLPDTANVIFGDISVSAVVGTQEVDLVVQPTDLESAQREFESLLGVEVNDTREVVDAIISGNVENPSEKRRELRSRLSPAFRTRSVNFNELDRRLDSSSIPAMSVQSFENHDAMKHAMIYQSLRHGHSAGGGHAHVTKARAARVKENVKEAVSQEQVAEVAKNAAVSEIVSRAVGGLL